MGPGFPGPFLLPFLSCVPSGARRLARDAHDAVRIMRQALRTALGVVCAVPWTAPGGALV